mmetsp:Transcript_13639/g.32719  ORF Transcript_13639/g.32719 Transcript_13639/m.32719 type:complete len:272 (+) Transcript_13639:1-816(+)
MMGGAGGAGDRRQQGHRQGDRAEACDDAGDGHRDYWLSHPAVGGGGGGGDPGNAREVRRRQRRGEAFGPHGRRKHRGASGVPRHQPRAPRRARQQRRRVLQRPDAVREGAAHALRGAGGRHAGHQLLWHLGGDARDAAAAAGEHLARLPQPHRQRGERRRAPARQPRQDQRTHLRRPHGACARGPHARLRERCGGGRARGARVAQHLLRRQQDGGHRPHTSVGARRARHHGQCRGPRLLQDGPECEPGARQPGAGRGDGGDVGGGAAGGGV